jgi:hypothetical protein
MTRNQFEAAAKQQNAERAAQVVDARVNGAPCVVVTMFAFGGVDYCSTHRVMGPCPFAQTGGAR